MVVWLTDWSTERRCVFRLEDGTPSRDANGPVAISQVSVGYVARCVGGFAMVYRTTTTDPVTFQFRAKRYSMTSGEYSFVHDPALFGFMSKLRVAHWGSERLVIRKREVGNQLTRIIDPARDALDDLGDDFLYWVSTLAKRPERLADNWRSPR